METESQQCPTIFERPSYQTTVRLCPQGSTENPSHRPLASLLVQAAISCEKRIGQKLCERATFACKQRHDCLSEVEEVR